MRGKGAAFILGQNSENLGEKVVDTAENEPHEVFPLGNEVWDGSDNEKRMIPSHVEL